MASDRPLNSFFSFARLCNATNPDDICIELMLSITLIRAEETEGPLLHSLPEIISKSEATPLECCLLFANECLTLNKNAMVCYGKVDSNLLRPLRHYLINETIIEGGFMNTLVNSFENAYFVVVDSVCYIPYLFLKFNNLNAVELCEYCANDSGYYSVNMSLQAWADTGYKLENGNTSHILKWYLPASLFQFKTRYPNKSNKLEFRDCINEYYEDRIDGLVKCVIVFGTEANKESQVYEYFEKRNDFLFKRSITMISNCVVEEFKYGRKDGLKKLNLQDKPTCYEFYDVRTDCLVKRDLKNGLCDFFSMRNDSLTERTYNNNLYVNKYDSTKEIEQLELNILNDTVKIIYRQKNGFNFRPFALLEKNSYTSESKDSFTVLECKSFDLKSTTEIKESVKNLFHFVAYEIKKILNERTELQTKADNILKDRSVQEKNLNGYSTETLVTKKKLVAHSLVEAFLAKENPEKSMTEFFSKQYELRLTILYQKLKEGLTDIEVEVIRSRIDKMQEERKEKMELYRKRMAV